MLEKIKKLKTSQTTKALSDVRSLGLMVFGVMAILVTWSSIKVVQTNYELQKQISVLIQQNDVQQLSNNNLKLKNQYLNTNEYLELAARRHFNKAAPGETLVIVPKSVALAKTVELPKAAEETDSNQAPSSEKNNFNAWLDFLFHRSKS